MQSKQQQQQQQQKKHFQYQFPAFFPLWIRQSKRNCQLYV